MMEPNSLIAKNYTYFTVRYNHFLDVSHSTENVVLDREEMTECECVIALPESYTEDGAPTQLVIDCHGAGSSVCKEKGTIGSLKYARPAVDAGYAVMDVCGSETHGCTMGCFEHLMALYKAYKYVISHFNVTEKILLAGASMGGHVAMNFANLFPSIVVSMALFYPRLNIDGVTVDGHYCIGTWDKTQPRADGRSVKELIQEIYRFPTAEWCEENTVGLNPYRIRSYVDAEGKRVVFPPCPIKIWQGTADTTVDPVMVEEFVNAVKRSGSFIQLRKLEGVAHKINDVMLTERVMWFNRFV